MRPAQSQRVATRATGTTAAEPVGQSSGLPSGAPQAGVYCSCIGPGALRLLSIPTGGRLSIGGRRRRAPARRAQRAGSAAALIDCALGMSSIMDAGATNLATYPF